jgi:hypothetical protein
MKAAIRCKSLNKPYYMVYCEDGKVHKVGSDVTGIWQVGDIGQLVNNNGIVKFKPYAEDIQVIDFKPFKPELELTNEQCSEPPGVVGGEEPPAIQESPCDDGPSE